MLDITNDWSDVLQVCRVLPSILSIFGAVNVISHRFYRNKEEGKEERKWAYDRVSRISYGNLIAAIGNVLTNSNEFLCGLQGFVLTFGGVMSFMYIILISLEIGDRILFWQKIIKGEQTLTARALKMPTEEERKQKIKWVDRGVISMSFTLSTIPWIMNGYQQLQTWCWISRDSAEIEMMRFVSYYGWMLLGFFVSVIIYCIYAYILCANKTLIQNIDEARKNNKDNSSKYEKSKYNIVGMPSNHHNSNHISNQQSTNKTDKSVYDYSNAYDSNKNMNSSHNNNNSGNETNDELSNIYKMDLRLCLDSIKYYPIIFVICYFPGAIRRLIPYFGYNEIAEEWYMVYPHIFLSCLWGFFNWIAFHQISRARKKQRQMHEKEKQKAKQKAMQEAMQEAKQREEEAPCDVLSHDHGQAELTCLSEASNIVKIHNIIIVDDIKPIELTETAMNIDTAMANDSGFPSRRPSVNSSSILTRDAPLTQSIHKRNESEAMDENEMQSLKS